MAQWLTNPTRNHEVAGAVPALVQWGVAMSCGRRGSDPPLLWLWHRPVATAPIGPLAWEPPYAVGAAQEKDKKTKQTKQQQQQQNMGTRTQAASCARTEQTLVTSGTNSYSLKPA